MKINLMIDKFISHARNLYNRVVSLLRGRLVTDDSLTFALNSLNEKLESKWNIELNIRVQKVIDEQQKILFENFQRFESRLNFLQDLFHQQILLVTPSTDGFEKSLKYELIKGLLSEFFDNFDPYCGATIEDIQQEINEHLAHYRQNFDMRVEMFMAQLPMGKLKRLHDQLYDSESKQLLARLIAYRLLGLTKVQLRSSANTEMDREFYAKLQDLISVEFPAYRSGSFEVPCYDLRKIGLNFRCYTVPFAINTEFRNRQYANDQVHVRPGDWVLDCGACWGDTSLWFAEQASPSGRVFSFEFIPSSIEIFHANLALNPALSECIELVKNPVAESSGKVVRCQDNGAASTFKIDQAENPNSLYVEAVTTSIDDWVNSHNLQKVDFIKMDIEGAELEALRGSMITLKRFRPRLAIALYHRPEDIYQIPDFLMSLNLNYRFYLKHPTAAGFETVLLAVCD